MPTRGAGFDCPSMSNPVELRGRLAKRNNEENTTCFFFLCELDLNCFFFLITPRLLGRFFYRRGKNE